MELSDHQLETLADLIAGRIQVSCDCGLTPEAQREMPHLLGMVKDIGGADYACGIEVLREMGKRYSRMSKTADYISKAILALLLASMFGGLVYLFKLGAAGLVKSIKG